jgi:hypothetical protein
MQLGMLLVMGRLLLMLIHCTVTVAGACKSQLSILQIEAETRRVTAYVLS